MTRRWLLCLTDGYGCGGGIAQYNRDLISHLAAVCPDDELHVIQRGGAAPEPLPPGVRWHAPAPGRLRYLLTVAWLSWRLRPALFCGHLYMAPLIALLARLLGLPWWLQLHGIEVWQSPPPRCLRAGARADLVTAVSRHTRREWLARVPVAPWRVRVLPNTAHAASAPPDVARRPHQVLVLTRLSASERYKGVHRLLAVLPALRDEFPDLDVVVAGEGDDRPWLMAETARLGLDDCVRFTGQVSHDERERLLAASAVFALPSSGEGFGIVFVEAAGAGCRVIAGAVDGSVDALAEGRFGQLVDPADDAALTAALRRALAGEVAPAAPEEVASRFAPEALRTQLAGLLDAEAARFGERTLHTLKAALARDLLAAVAGDERAPRPLPSLAPAPQRALQFWLQQGVAGFVLRHYDRAELGAALGEDGLARLDGKLRWQQRVALTLLVALRELLAQTQALGVPALVFKGVADARDLHGNVGVRQTSDIDLLIAPADRERLLAALLAAGWSLREGDYTALGPRGRAWYLRLNHALVLTHARTGVTLDLHWRVNELPLLALDESRWLPLHGQPAELAGQPCLAFTPGGRYLALLSHATRNEHVRLRWWLDLVKARALALAALGEDGLAALLADADAAAMDAAWRADLATLDAPLTMPRRSAAYWLLRDERQPPRDYVLRLWRARRSSALRLRLVFRELLRWDDVRRYPLPDRLFWLYFVLRVPLMLLRAVTPRHLRRESVTAS